MGEQSLHRGKTGYTVSSCDLHVTSRREILTQPDMVADVVDEAARSTQNAAR